MAIGAAVVGTIRKGSRRVAAEWQLSDNVVVELSAFHSKERKAFTATLNQVTVEQHEGYSSRSFTLFAGVTVGREQVARYSDKALQEFFDRMVGYVEFERSIDGKIADQFKLETETA